MDPAALVGHAAVGVQRNTRAGDLGDDGDVLLALLKEVPLDDVALGHAALQVSVAAGVFQLA